MVQWGGHAVVHSLALLTVSGNEHKEISSRLDKKIHLSRRGDRHVRVCLADK